MWYRFLFIVVLGVAVPLPLTAQEMPEWAAPQEPPVREAPQESAPVLPGDPSLPPSVPVDGGLALLALAGAGYAAHRLRRR